MLNSWIVLIPTFLVLFVAFATKKVIWGLLLGIASASLIVSDFSLKKATTIAMNSFSQQIELSNLYMFIFLIILGTLIAIMQHTGGTAAYAQFIKRRIHDSKKVETVAASLSLLFGIDEYFSILTVGSIMRSITDLFHIPRAKLAFFLDSLGTPFLIIMPVSTWIAMLIMQLEKAGISLKGSDKPLILADPFTLYLDVIPFTFYSIFIVASVFFIIRASISYGPMHQQELIAQKNLHLFGNKPALKKLNESLTNQQGSLVDFLMPITLLFGCIFLSILYLGNSILLGGKNSLIATLQNVDIFFALLIGATIAYAISILIFVIQKKLTLKEIPMLASSGLHLMKDSIIILLLAWTFSSLLKNDLKTGEYIAQTFIGSLNMALLPIMFFIAASITAAGTGSSWGTIAVLVPLAVPMLTTLSNVQIPATPEQISFLLPTLGAIFSGAAAGEHLSPIGTTTVMAASSAGCYLEDHVSTQFFYSIPAYLATCFAYLLIGYSMVHFGYQMYTITLLMSFALMTCMLLLANKFFSSSKK